MHRNHAITVLDHAHPTPPSSGTPRYPYMNTQLSGTLIASAHRFRTIMVRGFDTAVEKL